MKNSCYVTSSYIDTITSKDIRVTFSKIRLNASNLSQNPYTKSYKKCDQCDKDMDAKHLLLECSKHIEKRTQYLLTMDKCSQSFKLADSNAKLAQILNVEFFKSEKNSEMTRYTIAYVNSVYKSQFPSK